MGLTMVCLQRAQPRVQGACPFAALALCYGAALIFALAAPAIAQSGPTDSAPGIHTPAIRANKIVLPQTPGAQLISNHAAYPLGQPVLLQFKITNTTKKPLRYDFASGQQAQFTVMDTKGDAVWDSTQHKVSFHGITHLVLAPGQSQVYTGAWNQRDLKDRPVPPGPYTVTASLIAMPRYEISGGLIVNTDRDPANLGMPMKGHAETGETIQQNVTPSVSASTQIKIDKRS